jgi:hypothetical protein
VTPPAGIEASRSGLERGLRIVLLGLGLLLVARGLQLVLADVGPGQWLRIGLWLGLGIAVHDGLIAPAGAGLGRGLLPRLPAGTSAAARAGWLGAVTVLVVGLPLLVGANRRADPSVIPGHPLLGVLSALALLAAGCLLAALAGARRRRANG